MSTTQIGSYELIEEIGQGGMAVVYKAFQRNVKRMVAIKLIKDTSTDDPTNVERFQREAQIVARLQHPHILPLYDFDGFHNPPYIVMPYLEGGTLSDVRGIGTIPFEEMLLIIQNVCSALELAHKNNILHRDIKPTNILFDKDANVFLADFGLARTINTADSVLTATGDILGTPAYMTPEQIDDSPDLDHRADIYAMGIVTYELLTGKLPFEGSLAVILMGHLQTPPPPVSALHPELSEAVDIVIQRAMAKDAADRYPSAMDFSKALTEAFGTTVASELTMTRLLIQKRITAAENKHTTDKASAPKTTRIDSLPTPLKTPPKPDELLGQKIDTILLRDRRLLLDKVQKFWIEGVLEKSLYGAALLELQKGDAIEHIQHPWNVLLDTFENNKQYQVPHMLRTIHLFEDRGRAMLILGHPGTGKTTTLLELARDTVMRAKTDATQPVPIVFNLSSWTPRLTLKKWILGELKDKYGVPERISKLFLEKQHILLLLDGLDEVNRSQQKACVESINEFRAEHGLTPIVVTSRIDDYQQLGVKLRLEGALTLQNLNETQIRQYFASFGEDTAIIYDVVMNNPALKELAQSPLMLNVMVLAYKDLAKNEIELREDLISQRQHLFAHYVERMFRRRYSSVAYTREQMQQWLGWVACKMQAQQQAMFRIEALQPDWLDEAKHKNLYRFLAMATGLFTGFITGTLVAIAIYFVEGQGLENSIENTISSYLIGGIAGAITGVILAVKPRIVPLQELRWSQTFFKQRRIRYSVLGMIVGGLLYMVFSMLNTTFETNGFLFTYVGVIVGLSAGLAASGITSGQKSETQQPNQGIRRSARYALLFGSVAALISWIAISGMFISLAEEERTIGMIIFSVYRALLLTLPVLSGIALIAGGLAVLQHIVLRQTLAQLHFAPLNYVKFLDAATDLVFLRKVGGGYIFMHRFLLEHFAEKYAAKQPPSESKVQAFPQQAASL